MDCGIECMSCINVVGKKNNWCSDCQPVPSRWSKIKEARVAAELGQWASDGRIPIYTAWDRANPESKREICGKDRPDFSWDLGHRAVALEVDEFRKVMSEALAAPDLEHRIVIQHVWYDQATPDFVTTKRFKTLEDYEAWVQEEIPLEGYETQDYEVLEEEEAHSEDDEPWVEEEAP